MIIVITGPTGVGKTKMSVEIAKKLNGEVINADAMQVYKELNIGTAKIREEEKDLIPHHLFDIKDVLEDYSIYDYQKDCRLVIDDIISRGKIPILVGGSGLYIKSALYDYKFNDEVKHDFSSLSDNDLLDKIKSYDIEIDFDIKNRRRLERVLNKLLNNSYDVVESNLIYDKVFFIGLTTNRDNLYNIINTRVDKMVDDGLLEEVKYFYELGIRSKAIMTGIGYKELYSYFDNFNTLEESLDLIKQRSRKYAKRQYTFFNHQLPIEWFDVDYSNFDETIGLVYSYLTK